MAIQEGTIGPRSPLLTAQQTLPDETKIQPHSLSGPEHENKKLIIIINCTKQYFQVLLNWGGN